MRTVSAIARYLAGVIFLVFGLNGLLNFIPLPQVCFSWSTVTWKRAWLKCAPSAILGIAPFSVLIRSTTQSGSVELRG
jgi:hypothetical protein